MLVTTYRVAVKNPTSNSMSYHNRAAAEIASNVSCLIGANYCIYGRKKPGIFWAIRATSSESASVTDYATMTI